MSDSPPASTLGWMSFGMQEVVCSLTPTTGCSRVMRGSTILIATATTISMRSAYCSSDMRITVTEILERSNSQNHTIDSRHSRQNHQSRQTSMCTRLGASPYSTVAMSVYNFHTDVILLTVRVSDSCAICRTSPMRQHGGAR